MSRDKDVFPFELQVRTEDMDLEAEFGICAHWRHKGLVDAGDAALYRQLAQIQVQLESLCRSRHLEAQMWPPRELGYTRWPLDNRIRLKQLVIRETVKKCLRGLKAMSHASIGDLSHLPLSEPLLDLLHRVGDEMLKQYSVVEKCVVIKDDDSPQTIADRSSEDRILGFLKANSPFPVFSEEAADHTQIEGDTFWTVDPLDGTKDFIEKTGEFSVMLSFVEHFCPVFGMVYHPITGRIYAAERGKGAYMIEPEGTCAPIHVSSTTRPQDLRMLVSRTHPQKEDAIVAAALGTTNIISHGSFGLKIGLIACGEAEIMFYVPGFTSAWDWAPNLVILSEAGGRITDLNGRELLIDPSKFGNQYGIIATNGCAHEQLLEVVHRVCKLDRRDPPIGFRRC